MNVNVKMYSILGLIIVFSIPLFCNSQVIWSEDFESYQDDTGFRGSTTETSGDYPNSVSKWTLDVSNSTMTDNNSWFMVNTVSSNKVFEAKNVKGEAIWQSEKVDISGYVDVCIRVAISEVGTHESNDYIKLYYKLDDGSETLFSVNGENYDDFSSLTALQPGLSGDSLRIIIKTLNTAASEKIRFDDIKVEGVLGSSSLIFTEISDPSDSEGGRFVELMNTSDGSINFDEVTYYLSRQNQGDENEWGDFKLSGSLPKNGLLVIGKNNSDFNSSYGCLPQLESSIVDGNGRDTYALYSGANHLTGAIVDIYGKIDEDGNGQDWDYTNKRAVRNSNIVVGVNEWSDSEWQISSATVNNLSPGALESEYRYDGSNWFPNAIAPNALSDNENVVIQSGQVSINTSFDCGNLTIFSGSTLELESGRGLTVNGDLSNSGILNLKSDASSSSSLIVTGSSSGNIQYDLHVTGGASSPWHLISAPVEAQSIDDFVTNENNSIQVSSSNNYGLATYSTATDAWNYYHNGLGSSPNILSSTAGNFLPSIGYSTLRSTDGNLSFTGTVNTDDQTLSLAAGKWNLIGNPYPSFINVNTGTNLISESSSVLNPSYQAVYMWNPETSSYDVINNASGASYLSPGQGFFVYAASEGGNLSFTEAMQSHQTGDWFQRGEQSWSSLKLRAEFESTHSSTEVKFIEATTYGLDLGFDAGRFNGANNDYYLFTQLVDGTIDSLELGLQCIPLFNQLFVEPIPVGVFANENTELKFTLSLSEFNDDVWVYLEDALLETYTRLDVGGSYYSTSVNAMENSTGRFYLHVQSSELKQIEVNDETVDIFFSNDSKTLQLIGGTGSSQLKLFDSLGRLVFHSHLIVEGRTEVSLHHFNSGVYVVQLKINDETINKKIVIP
jgi:hypothetical protein